MPSVDKRLREDRAVRDAARNLIEADLGIVKGDVKERGVGSRAATFASEHSRNVAHGALAYASQKPIMAAGIVTAILAFLFRDTLIDALISWLDRDEKPNAGAMTAGNREEQNAASRRSPTTQPDNI